MHIVSGYDSEVGVFLFDQDSEVGVCLTRIVKWVSLTRTVKWVSV